MSITVTADNLREAQRALRSTPKDVNTVLSRAVNEAVRHAKVGMSKTVRGRYKVPASDVKSSAKSKSATKDNPVSVITVSGLRLGFVGAGGSKRFPRSPAEPNPARPPKAYKIQIMTEGGLKPVPQGFLSYAKGTLGFFKRTGKGRYPVVRLTAPAIPEMVGNRNVYEIIEKDAAAYLNERFRHQLQYLLEKRKNG